MVDMKFGPTSLGTTFSVKVQVARSTFSYHIFREETEGPGRLESDGNFSFLARWEDVAFFIDNLEGKKRFRFLTFSFHKKWIRNSCVMNSRKLKTLLPTWTS